MLINRTACYQRESFIVRCGMLLPHFEFSILVQPGKGIFYDVPLLAETASVFSSTLGNMWFNADFFLAAACAVQSHTLDRHRAPLVFVSVCQAYHELPAGVRLRVAVVCDRFVLLP